MTVCYTELIVTEREPFVDGTTTEPSTTESYTHGAPNAHLPTFSDFTPYVLAGAGGLFLFFVFIILVSVFVQKKRKPIVRYASSTSLVSVVLFNYKYDTYHEIRKHPAYIFKLDMGII